MCKQHVSKSHGLTYQTLEIFFNSEQFRNNVHGISKEFEIYIQNVESVKVLSVTNNLFSLSHYFSVCFCAD